MSHVKINRKGESGRDGPALVPCVHCEISFLFCNSNFVNIFDLISTKNNFILLRFYGESVLYKLNEKHGMFLNQWWNIYSKCSKMLRLVMQGLQVDAVVSP